MAHQPLAHVSEDGRVHLLQDHLIGSAKRSESFADTFGFRGWGYLAGLWHDLGKYSPAFQTKIHAALDPEAHLEAKTRVDHSTAGALHAINRLGPTGRILAYLTAGHHAGLPDWMADRYGSSALSHRITKTELLSEALTGEIPADILDHEIPNEKPTGFDPSFWIRMLFSCVVDADFLDTEEFFDPGRSAQRGGYPAISELVPKFDDYMDGKTASAPDTMVNRIRKDILQRCYELATGAQGIYSLTVPTGGGKTLSSMAFALNHAAKNELRRVIYVIPYTSIIEQTADQFREVFGEVIIEHHSNIDVTDASKETPRSRLACENWDAPIIVTTSVQFFESLYANWSIRCRKLHNIAKSVVILDEVQLLSPDFLKPILQALSELQRNYGVTILLSTATQPALESRDDPGFKFKGLDGVVEIVESPVELYRNLKRVDVSIPRKPSDITEWKKLAVELCVHSSVLCIVSRRDDCRHLWELMPEGTYHLSALMCGAHRSRKIKEIKERMMSGEPTRVISTQLVEAGVDLDFPVVYRAMAGLDSIAQAAGRCNREGKLERGKVIVFNPPSKPPTGVLRQAADVTCGFFTQGLEDPLAPGLFTAFFKELYWLQGDRLDRKGILRDLSDGELRFSFRTVADRFKLIDDTAQASVLVRYGEEGSGLISQLGHTGPERWLMRRLQRYCVNLPRYVHEPLVRDGTIKELHPGIYAQGLGSAYHDDLGFCPDRNEYQPDELIV